jgi:hypothetical protein
VPINDSEEECLAIPSITICGVNLSANASNLGIHHQDIIISIRI